MGPSCLGWCRDKKKNISGQLIKGERGLQASGMALGKLHKETSTESREQKNLMKKGEMSVRSHEGLKNEEIWEQTGCCLSEEQLGKSQAWEFPDAGNKVATASWALRTEAGPGDTGKDPLCSTFRRAFLEYCIQVLAPQCRKVTREVEGVQGSTTGIAGLEHPACVERLGRDCFGGTKTQLQCPLCQWKIHRRCQWAAQRGCVHFIFLGFQDQTGWKPRAAWSDLKAVSGMSGRLDSGMLRSLQP